MRTKLFTSIRLSDAAKQILEDIARKDELHLAAQAQTPQSLIKRGYVPAGEEATPTTAAEVFAVVKAWAIVGMDLSTFISEEALWG